MATKHVTKISSQQVTKDHQHDKHNFQFYTRESKDEIETS